MVRDKFIELLGALPRRPFSLDIKTLEVTDCGKYDRHKIIYNVENNERISAYICIPKNITKKVPGVFCHHQHNGEFNLGKSEVVGLAGDPEQAYAAELAERGYVTIATDALAFEDRNWHNEPFLAEAYEATARITQGSTFMAKLLHDLSVALDVLCGINEVDENKIGFLGHSYGGKMAFWAAAYDHRIKAAVSHCGSISLSRSLDRDAGVLPELTIPGFLKYGDVADVAKLAKSKFLISATTQDIWSESAEELHNTLIDKSVEASELKIYEDKHRFSQEMREYAYEFLKNTLS